VCTDGCTVMAGSPGCGPAGAHTPARHLLAGGEPMAIVVVRGLQY